MKDFKKEIREICTYYSEDGEGTAGYCLSEKQFQELFTLIDEEIRNVLKTIIGKK